MEKATDAIAASLGSDDVIALETTSASPQHNGPGRNWSGPLYVATPQLLKAFGITPSEINPDADLLTMRPGLSGTSGMQLTYGNYFSGNGPPPGGDHGGAQFPCPKSDCLANPVIEEVSALPSGTSAPNTVITEHAVRSLGLRTLLSGWLVQSPNPPAAAEITNARAAAGGADLTIETRNSAPSSSEIINWATVFGIALALGVLAMSVGLIRSETAGDLRILAATGASSRTRRTLTAVTAGALGLLGAVLGTVAGYIGVLGYVRSNSLNGGISALGSVPVGNLLVILIGMPLLAAVVGWVFSGRQPPAMAHQPIE